MADFELDASDLNSTKSIVEKIASHYYPNGEVVVKNTTMSQLPMQDRQLRSADPARILQGDGLYRNPAFAIAAYAQTTQSALHGVLSSLTDVNDDIKVPDPNDPTGEKFLTGSQAKLEIMRQLNTSTGLAPNGFEATIKAMNDSIINEATIPGADTGTAVVTSSDGTSVGHGAVGYSSSSNFESLNGGSRAIALEENLTEEEKNIYQKKISELHSKVNFRGSVNSFIIDFNRNRAGQDLGSLGFEIYQVGTSFGGAGGRTVPVPQELLGSGKRKCYISAALVELLLQLTNTIYIDGGTGSDRTIVSSNFSALSAENNGVSDHSFGRGFDIMAVGDTAGSAIPLVSSLDNFRRGLDLFLSTLQKLPRYLHPDLIIVHDELASELGILESGLEGATAAVRTRYPGISPYVNFACDRSHRNHIHISFSPQRAGSFLSPASPEAISSLGGPITTIPIGVSNIDNFKVSFFNQPNKALTPDEVMSLLVSTGLFSEEVAAIFVGIAQRESNYRPYALNTNRTTGDFSFGLFQCNLLPGAHGKKTFILKYPSDSTELGLKLAYSIDDDRNIDSLSEKVKKLASNSTVDQRIFIPYNQAYMLAVTAKGTEETSKRLLNNKKFDGYLFGPWGDYKGTYGFINKVKFSTIESVYTSTGRKIETLKSWIRLKFKNNKPFPYIEEWMNGEYYNENV